MRQVYIVSSFLLCLALSFSGWSNDLPFKPNEYVFSGIVSSEDKQNFGYYFSLKKESTTASMELVVYSLSDNQIILDAHESLENNSSNHLSFSQGFLDYDLITNAWTLGYQLKDSTAIRLKFDMLAQHDIQPQSLGQHVRACIRKADSVNGHIRLPGAKSDLFVLAARAWVREIENQAPQPKLPPQGLLCQFDNGEGLYSINTTQYHSLMGSSVVGYYDSFGQEKPISQFIRVKKDKTNTTSIDIKYPKLHFNLSTSDILPLNASHQAGKVQGTYSGFCFWG